MRRGAIAAESEPVGKSVLRAAVAVTAAASLIMLAGCSGPATPPPAGPFPDALPGAAFQARVEDSVTALSFSDGDLWPNCWSDDDAVYTANGDGTGFGIEFFDVAMNRVTGSPDDPSGVEGEVLVGGDELGQIWSGPGFTRKPTGMLCVDGTIYLAVQDLRRDFNEAPVATIARSDDHGLSWEWDPVTPMFDDNVFTTVFFADFGKDSEHAPDGWAYAYGLDGNWRDSFDDSVPDPTELFLARVPTASVQDRTSWEFYTGTAGDEPTWSTDIADKEPVLVDERRAHPSDPAASGSEPAAPGTADLSVISQGGVTYIPALDRYIYTSWTELTFEFYEAPNPWGPFTLFVSEDFGPYPWSEARFGGYGTTIPSKYVSDDGLTMWVQSNVCPCAPAGMLSYWFGLRKLELQPVK